MCDRDRFRLVNCPVLVRGRLNRRLELGRLRRGLAMRLTLVMVAIRFLFLLLPGLPGFNAQCSMPTVSARPQESERAARTVAGGQFRLSDPLAKAAVLGYIIPGS